MSYQQNNFQFFMAGMVSSICSIIVLVVFSIHAFESSFSGHIGLSHSIFTQFIAGLCLAVVGIAFLQLNKKHS